MTNLQLHCYSLGRTVISNLMLAVLISAICFGITGICNALVVLGFLPSSLLREPSAILLVLAIISLCVSVLMSVCINNTFVKPLRAMTEAMGELASGNFSLRLSKEDFGGPLGNIEEVEAFARSFNTAAQELAGTEMMRRSFISDFSHEFRTPISSLSGFAQLLRSDDLTKEERDEYLGIIVDESQRLAGLSERILLLSKMEAMGILPEEDMVNVAETIRRAALMEESRAIAKGVRIELVLDECQTRGDGDYLTQLWTNILDNAVKFSPEGGTVSVALYGGRRGEEGRQGQDDQLVCWISDEGCGMDEETKRHLFERFYQGDTSHASEGSGLGLALCWRIVELHHGSIEVQSSPGKGSVFEVRLPMA